MTTFYDEVAKKLGGYGFANDNLTYRSEYPSGDPELEFYNAVMSLAGQNSTALDIGCGDGIFSFRVADAFLKIDGIDNSKELIKIAKQKATELGKDNVHFVFGDAGSMPYKDATFDAAFNRRGPSFYEEYCRVLIPGGAYVEVGIGEQDSRALKEVFGRGQDYMEWVERRVDKDKQAFKQIGFSVVRAEDYFYKEFYPSREMFEVFLEGVPIFEDFDRQKDKELLDKYCASHTTANGEIALDRHRVLYVLRKKK
jgi:ubiquinone/menaquinone biosynthesis C-methylase UbiE